MTEDEYREYKNRKKLFFNFKIDDNPFTLSSIPHNTFHLGCVMAYKSNKNDKDDLGKTWVRYVLIKNDLSDLEENLNCMFATFMREFYLKNKD